jgi:hypothetical protein
MGLRNFHNFNMAILAKQAWSFMTKLDTLVAKIYKATYFPNSTLFDSHIWFECFEIIETRREGYVYVEQMECASGSKK